MLALADQQSEPQLSQQHVAHIVKPLLAVIDSRLALNECLVAALNLADSAWQVRGFHDLSAWRAYDSMPTTMLVLCLSSRSAQSGLGQISESLNRNGLSIPFVIVSDDEDGTAVMQSLEHGAKGHIPTSLRLRVLVEALRLVWVGGVFIPAQSLRQIAEQSLANSFDDSVFSSDELRIVEKVWRGTPNKTIASELGISESAVKSCIRTLMKAMKVRNRTELAYRMRYNEAY